MKIRNVTSGTREIAATGQLVRPGATVDVEAELGTALARQVDVWRPEPPAKTTTRRSKSTAVEAGEED